MKRFICLILLMALITAPASAQTLIPDIPLGYKNVTSFTYNITTNAGTQTNYPVRFILSNSSGVSGIYSGENIIYTNGTTRPDWYDVNATDGSSTPLKFWIENNTQTATNATAWVNVPSISTANSSTGKWYYGNASQNGSAADGLNTFPYIQDYIAGSLNTTQEVAFGSGGSMSISGGVNAITPGTGSYYGTTTLGNYGLNYSVRSRFYATAEDAQRSINSGFRNTASTSVVLLGTYNNGANNGDYRTTAFAGGTTYVTRTPQATAYYVWEASRYGGGSGNGTANFSSNNALKSTITTTVPSASANVTQAVYKDSGTQIMYVDWTLVRPCVFPEPITSSYSTASTSSSDASLTASFTDAPDPSSTGQSVSFTDTSTGSPTTWNWTFGDIGGSNTSTSQNPTHTYSAAGNYTVLLNVSNSTGSFSTASAWHDVTNASAFYTQDVWMEGQYTVTFPITDSTTGAAINNATVLSSSGGSAISNLTGYAVLTEGFGVYTGYFSATGYASKSISFVVDQDTTMAVQLTPATVVNPYNVKYPPKDVRFHAQTKTGSPLPLTWVSAVPYHTPLGSYEYVATLFGYDLSTTPLDTLELNGTTDSHGDITFAMMTDVQYYVNATKSGYTFQSLNITPHDDNYLITADYTGSIFVTNGSSPASNVAFDTDYTRINLTTGVINLSVVDTAGIATGGVFNITQKNTTSFNSTLPIQIAAVTFTGNQSMANFTLIDATVAGCPSSTSAIYNTSGSVIGCFNKTLVDDSSYQTSCKVNTPSGTVYETGIVWFKKLASPIAGLSPEFALFSALSIMMFTALMAAGPSSAPPMSIVVCFEGWIFYGLNMFVLLEGVTKSGMPIVPVVLTFMTFIAIVFNFTEYRRKNK